MFYFFTALFGMTFPVDAIRLPAPEPVDARMTKLEMFFDRYQCPQPHYSYSYLQAADANSLDYRLLPAISVRESTCGQYERFNNRWGWGNAFARFSSVPRGIALIARQLAWGANYRDRPVRAKLRKYNPHPRYSAEVEKLMRQIDANP